MKGELIISVEEVIELANQGKCVLHYHLGIIPAAFIQNWQARVLVNSIKNGYLFKYIKNYNKTSSTRNFKKVQRNTCTYPGTNVSII